MPPEHGPTRLSRAVALGGGHGLSRSLQALRRVSDEVVAVVTVADDGGSSGRLRRDLDVIPPGDLRMALAALATDTALCELVQHRFERGELTGHSLGNLMLIALQERLGGDMVAALDRLAALLGVRGRALPCTPTPVTLHAETSQGPLSGQARIAASGRISRLAIAPARAPATPDAVAAISSADLVVLGPGSLYTSLIPNLLVPGIGAAVAASPAPVVLVANLRAQPGETDDMTLAEHLTALRQHVDALRVDVLVVHDGAEPSGPGAALQVDDDLAQRVPRVVRTDLLDGADGHDPSLLAEVLRGLVDGRSGRGGRADHGAHVG